jgi:hypothetical protein
LQFQMLTNRINRTLRLKLNQNNQALKLTSRMTRSKSSLNSQSQLKLKIRNLNLLHSLKKLKSKNQKKIKAIMLLNNNKMPLNQWSL